MSVINQMLRELDLRFASAGAPLERVDEVGFQLVPASYPPQSGAVSRPALIPQLIKRWVVKFWWLGALCAGAIYLWRMPIDSPVAPDLSARPLTPAVAQDSVPQGALPKHEADPMWTYTVNPEQLLAWRQAPQHERLAQAQHVRQLGAVEPSKTSQSVSNSASSPEAGAAFIATKPASKQTKLIATEAASQPVAGAAPTALNGPQEQRVMISPSEEGLATQQRSQLTGLYRQAVNLVAEGRDEAALQLALQALNVDAKYLPARYVALRMALNLKQFERVANLLETGFKQEPQDPELIYLKARYLSATGLNEEALQVLAAIQHPNADVQGLKAGLLAGSGRYVQAVSAYQEALRERPGHALWWVGLGVALNAQGQTQSARQAFTHALSLGTLSASVKSWVEEQLQRQGNP